MSATGALGKENVFKCYVNILFSTSTVCNFPFIFVVIFTHILQNFQEHYSEKKGEATYFNGNIEI